MTSFRKAVVLFSILALGPSCNSSSAPPKAPLTIPLAPTGLALTPRSSARIDLSWTDASVNEVEFRIWRGDSPAGPFVQVGTVPANATAFSDLGLDPLSSYFYQVTAWNSAGDSPIVGPLNSTTMDLAWAGPFTGGPALGLTQHSAIFDSAGQRMIVFGGVDTILNFYNDVLQFDLSNDVPGPWAPVTTTGTVPPLFDHSAIYDSLNKRMIVFGGEALYSPPSGDILVYQNTVYVLDLDPASPAYLAWSQPAVTGTPPLARSVHTAIYDSANQRMVVYGGYDGTFELQDAATLTLPASGPFVWGPGTAGGPVRRQQHASIYDPLRSRMVSFGGQDSNNADGSLLNKETWSLSLQGPFSWANLSAAGTPGFRMGHSGIYDAVNQRMVVFGGYDTTTPTASGELWGLRLDGTPVWGMLTPSAGPGPAPRSRHTAVYDPVHRRMVLFGGMDDLSNAYDDVWVIPL